MMRLKQIMILTLCLLFATVFQPVTVAEDAAPVRTIPITSKGFGAKLSPDGRTLVTYENIILLDLKAFDPTLLPMRVIDISTGEERGQLMGFSDYATDAVFSGDGSRLISAHQNGDIYVWDMATLTVVKMIQTPLLGNYMIKLFGDDKRILALESGLPSHFLVIDLESGAITTTLGKHFESFLDFQTNYIEFPAAGDIQFAGFAISPDGRLVASATFNDEVGLWTLADKQYTVLRKKSEQVAQFSVRQMTFTADGKSLIYYDYADTKTHIWDVASQSETAALAVGADNFVLSADGTQIAWATRSKLTGDAISVAQLNAPDQAAVIFKVPEGLTVAPRVTWLAFTPDGQQVVVGGFFAADAAANQIDVLNVP